MSDFDAKALIKSLPGNPGVYRMFDVGGTVIYVGKARNLKNRVSSYFRSKHDSPKTRSLVEQIQAVEVTVTNTEAEALLLEQDLIKSLKPRYNILLRDDKSYPYIYLSEGDEFPRLSLHRGARKARGRYFGPYPSAGAVRETLQLLQKVFKVRQCEDSFFRNRSRPCLQYQINRCKAPCTDFIDAESYASDVRDTVMFLDGRSSRVINGLVSRMEKAAENLDFEQAAVHRDQISQLQRVQERQYVSAGGGDVDVIACVVNSGQACVQVFFFRDGRNLGNKSFFPKLPEESSIGDVLNAFIGQYYIDKPVPPEILLNTEPEDPELLAQALAARAQHSVELSYRLRGTRSRWVQLAARNADHALAVRLASKAGMQQRFESLQEALSMDFLPARMECFDISHTQGEATVASCVVFNEEGPLKSDYRRFNIRDIEPGDDYAAMHQALTRRYKRIQEGEGRLPDVLLIDGGKGQVSQALDVLRELQVKGVFVVGVAKGPGRKPGLEALFLFDSKRPLILPDNSPGLHLVQQIRDEAHRFAITGHRNRRDKKRTVSPLEHVAGVGPKRRQQLLKQFGGLQQLGRAGIEDIARVDGISKALAERIHDALNENR